MNITIERDEPLAEINLSLVSSYGYKRYEPIIESLGFKITSTPVNNESEKYNLGYKKGNDTLNLGIITFSSSESKSILEAAFSSYDFVLTKIAPQNNVPNSAVNKPQPKPSRKPNNQPPPNNDKKNKEGGIPLDENDSKDNNEHIPDMNKKILEQAKSFIGSRDWSYFRSKTNFDGKAKLVNLEYKCNQFVHDVLHESGINLDLPNKRGWKGAIGFAPKARPYICRQWYNEQVPNFICIGKGVDALNKSLPGDIITNGKHMGIISGKGKTISANSSLNPFNENKNIVIENDFGWREEEKNVVKIFRYNLDDENNKDFIVKKIKIK